MLQQCLDINEKGHLTIGDVDTIDLVQKYGTPLYVMDEATIRNTLRGMQMAVKELCPNGGLVAFASKACSFKEIYRLAASESCGADVVSIGEMYTACCTDLPASNLIFHGNNKTEEELRFALEKGIGRIVVDNVNELNLVSRVACEMKKEASVLLRLTPGIEAHTHKFIQTGQIDSKFGIIMENGDAMKAVKKALSLPGILLKGVHCHIGSQICDEKPMLHAADVMLQFIQDVYKETGVMLSDMDLGGGFGIPYTKEDDPKNPAEIVRELANEVVRLAEEKQMPVPFLIVEPGRSVVGPAGITLYTVGGIKEIPNIRTYVSVDGGMTDNPRYMLYNADYPVVIANKASEKPEKTVTIAGHCCESGDLIQENICIQDCACGDILAVMMTGAYNYSMASNYNRFRRPPVVMIKDKVDRVVVKRESLEDIVRNDV